MMDGAAHPTDGDEIKMAGGVASLVFNKDSGKQQSMVWSVGGVWCRKRSKGIKGIVLGDNGTRRLQQRTAVNVAPNPSKNSSRGTLLGLKT